jgi:multiple sugar transport system permease protein
VAIVGRQRGVFWKSPWQRRELLTGLAFASPWIVGFLAFIAYPAAASLYYSLTDFNLLNPPGWVGFANYRQLLFDDDDFKLSLSNTIYITAIGVPVQLLFAFATAFLLDLRIRGQSFARTIYVLPSVMPTVAATILWLWLLNPELGPVNYLLTALRLPSPGWFADPNWAKPSIILMSLWGIGSTTVIYLAGLQNVPRELYEAAEIDGAGPVAKLRHITVPLLSPITLFNLVTGVIWSLQFFTPAFVIGNGATGDPQGSLLFYALYLYANAFSYLKMGYASAMAWILFLVTIAVTFALIRGSRRWIHYG